MRVVGVVPAAGHATRLRPLGLTGSKEMLPVGGRPVMDHLVERMRVGGAAEIRIVTRPEKEDVIAHAGEIGAVVVRGAPETVSASFLLGMGGLDEHDVALIGFPDTIWEPADGFRVLVAAVDAGCDLAAGLFRIDPADLSRSDVVVLGEGGRLAGVEIKPAAPPSEWIWGCAAARVSVWAGLAGTEWPGEVVDALCRAGRDVRGIELSDSWIDVGTPDALARARAADAGQETNA